MAVKQFLALLLLGSWLWLAGVVMPLQANGTVPEQTSPEVKNLKKPPPSGTDTQPGSVSNGTNQQQPFAVSPDTNTEHDQKLCESPELIVARCEPTPGSPLSAFPLVLNTEHVHGTASAA